MEFKSVSNGFSSRSFSLITLIFIQSHRTKNSTTQISAIQMLIIDQMDVLSMQNWDHVSHIFEHTHLQPSQSHGIDFSRVRMWSLNGLSKFYRQTILFSSMMVPEIQARAESVAEFHKSCFTQLYYSKTPDLIHF